MNWSIEQMRWAVEQRSFVVIGGDRDEVADYCGLTEEEQEEREPPEGCVVDVQTANLLVTIYEASSEKNRAKLLAMPVQTAGAVAWRLVARQEARGKT